MILPELLKTLRTRMLMSQETFAKEMHVTVCTINRWENGKSKPNITAINTIKSFCNKNNIAFEEIENAWHEVSKNG